jgi:hypothetical protein
VGGLGQLPDFSIKTSFRVPAKDQPGPVKDQGKPEKDQAIVAYR